jgi:hypothetical protein
MSNSALPHHRVVAATTLVYRAIARSGTLVTFARSSGALVALGEDFIIGEVYAAMRLLAGGIL